MRRWRKILLVSACGIALIACAWLLWDAWVTKPIIVRLPNQTTLTLYAMTRGPEPTFPDPNPFKRVFRIVREIVQAKAHRNPAIFDKHTAFWWFKVNPTLLPHGGLPLWRTTIHPTTNDPLSGPFPNAFLYASQSSVMAFYRKDCPTNTPTMVINFVTLKTNIVVGESYFSDVITNITVPNPMYRR